MGKAVYAAATVVVFALVMTATARVMGYRMAWVPPAEQSQVLPIQFHLDNPNGEIFITDASTGRTLSRMPSETNRFVKSLASGLDFQRKRDGHDTGTPYELVRWNDNRVSLRDPETGKLIELAAFGRDQVLIFAKLLEPKSASAAVGTR